MTHLPSKDRENREKACGWEARAVGEGGRGKRGHAPSEWCRVAPLENHRPAFRAAGVVRPDEWRRTVQRGRGVVDGEEGLVQHPDRVVGVEHPIWHVERGRHLKWVKRLTG